jgi:hypothetical protein
VVSKYCLLKYINDTYRAGEIILVKVDKAVASNRQKKSRRLRIMFAKAGCSVEVL